MAYIFKTVITIKKNLKNYKKITKVLFSQVKSIGGICNPTKCGHKPSARKEGNKVLIWLKAILFKN